MCNKAYEGPTRLVYDAEDQENILNVIFEANNITIRYNEDLIKMSPIGFEALLQFIEEHQNIHLCDDYLWIEEDVILLNYWCEEEMSHLFIHNYFNKKFSNQIVLHTNFLKKIDLNVLWRKFEENKRRNG